MNPNLGSLVYSQWHHGREGARVRWRKGNREGGREGLREERREGGNVSLRELQGGGRERRREGRGKEGVRRKNRPKGRDRACTRYMYVVIIVSKH